MTRDNFLTDDEFTELIDMSKSKNKYTSVSIKNPILGDIILPHGRLDDTTRKGYGFEHLVYERLFKDGLNNDEIAGLVIRTLELLKNATESQMKELEIIKKNNNKTDKMKKRVIVENKNISVILAKESFADSDMWVITSYPLFKKGTQQIKKEALVSLRTVIATKGYAQHYSFFCNAVGALTSRFIISKNSQNVNGGQEI